MITYQDLTGQLAGVPLEYARFLCICQYLTRDAWSRGCMYNISLLQANNAGSGLLVLIEWNAIKRVVDPNTFSHIVEAVVQHKWDAWSADFNNDICIFPYGTVLTYAEGVE